MHLGQPHGMLLLLLPLQEKNRFTKDGTLFLTSTRHRTQRYASVSCLAADSN